MSRQFANEKTFDDNLQRIGDLYEEGKDNLHTILPLEQDSEERTRLYDILREMRDIAAINLRANHEIKDN